MKNQKGVTLVEVVSCLAVMIVLAGMAFPAVENIKAKLELHGEVSKLIGELHKARVYAIKSNARVVFQYTDKGYTTFIDDGSNGGTKMDWVQQSGEQNLAEVSFGERIKISLADSTFTAKRTCFSGKPGISAGSVVLVNSNGNKCKIIVNSIGRVRVVKL